jgi:hypothetical protein
MTDNPGEGLDPYLPVLQVLVLGLDRPFDDLGLNLDLYLVVHIVMVLPQGKAPPEVTVAVAVGHEVAVIVGQEVAVVQVAMDAETHIGGEVVQDRFLGGVVAVETASHCN